MRKWIALAVAYAIVPAAIPAAIARRSVARHVGRHVAGPLAHAAIGQARNRPHEWGGGAGGFSKRFASGLGQHFVKLGIESGVAGLHHESLRYQRSNLQGTWPRMKYAVKSTFIVPRKNRPGKTVALGRVSGNLGAGMISRAWQPASSAGLGAGLASGGMGLGADVGVNVAREFWPRHNRRRYVVRRRVR